jgi:preprotein translocase subunit SecA
VRFQQHIYVAVEQPYKDKVEEVDANQEGLMHRLEKQLFLQQIDQLWKDHLTTMDQLRTGIGLRGYGQRDPKKEYQKEGYRLFSSLLVNVKSKVLGQLVRVQIQSEAEVEEAQAAYHERMEEQQRQMKMIGGSESADGDGGVLDRSPRRRVGTVRRARPKIGRNDPCWCGSGKKYKKCHMGADAAAERSGGTVDRDEDDASPPEATT